MDHPPREMKGVLYTRHNQTVLPLLANTKKYSLQAIHTSFVNTAIDNMTDNRVINNLPPSINDDESYLTRQQRAALSQIRFGHCKLLNSYKKMVPTISAYTRWNCLATTDASKSRSTHILTVRCSFQRIFCLGLVRCG